MPSLRPAPVLALLLSLGLAACGSTPAAMTPPPQATMYGAKRDGDRIIPAVPSQDITPAQTRREVTHWTKQKPGTIIVDPGAYHLYLVLGHNKAMRYSVGVGKAGYGFSGTATVAMKRKWPTWTPTQNQLKRTPELDMPWKNGMPGGLANPLGARALYLYRDGKDTLYRIHGTPYSYSIGSSDSDGCIRLYNQDILDLYKRVKRGAKVIVLRPSQTGLGTYPPGKPPARVVAERKAAEARAKTALGS